MSEGAGAAGSSAPITVITGPTASGKGALGFELARRIGGEIISMDSMKIYREIDVATAKPPAGRRAGVPYHLIDIVTPDVEFSAAEYLALLESTLTEIRARGRPAVVVGGTALYLKAFLEGLRTGPPADWALRERLLEEARSRGPEVLHERLVGLDPAAAAKIHPRDLRRLLRALEVIEKTGEAISREWSWGREAPPRATRIFGLEWERAELHARIHRRVDQMVERGLFEEAARLRARQPPPGRSASQSIGLKEVWRGLEEGRSREEIVARIQQGTRRLAKAQLTWFRKLPIEWIPARERSPESLADEVQRRLARPGSPA